MSKRIAGIVAGILCTVSLASAQSVTSGIFGFTKVVAPAGDFKMIGTAFDVGADGVITLDEMLGTNGFYTSWSALEADKVYIWDKVNSEYISAFLNSDVWGAEDSHFKWCYMDDVPVPCSLAPAYNLVPGDAVYVEVKNEVEIVISGSVPTVSTTEVSIVEGYNMMMNPYPVDTELKDIIPVRDGAHADWSELNADKIYLWDNASKSYKSYFLNSDVWGAADSHFKWCYMDGVPVPATNTISANSGFYYYKETAGLMIWAKDRPYDVD